MIAAILQAADHAEVAPVLQPADADCTANRLGADDPVVRQQRIAALLEQPDAHQPGAGALAELAGIVLEPDRGAQLVHAALEIGSAAENDSCGGEKVCGCAGIALL